MVRTPESAQGRLEEVDRLEEEFLRCTNAALAASRGHADARAAAAAVIQNTQAQLGLLAGACPLRDLFFIWSEGAFGTISGLR